MRGNPDATRPAGAANVPGIQKLSSYKTFGNLGENAACRTSDKDLLLRLFVRTAKKNCGRS